MSPEAIPAIHIFESKYLFQPLTFNEKVTFVQHFPHPGPSDPYMMVWHFNVHLLANALDSACLCCSGEISWLTPANIFKRGHNLIYLLENLNSKIINLKIVEIEICTRLIFSKLSRSRSARDSDLKIVEIETQPRLQFSRLSRPRLLKILLKLSRSRFFRDSRWSLT